MSACPSCRAPSDPSDAFCGSCGAALRPSSSDARTPARCARCQGLLEPGDPFCGGCGARVGGGAPSPPRPPGPPPQATQATQATQVAQATQATQASAPLPPGRAPAATPQPAAPAPRPPPPDPFAGLSPPTPPTLTRSGGRTLYVLPASQRELAPWLEQYGPVLVTSYDEAQEEAQVALLAEEPTAVCLLGPPWELPMFELEDPTGRDTCVPTDNFYGTSLTPDDEELWSGEGILPEVPVGRIPFSDPKLISQVFRQGHTLVPHWQAGLAVSAAVWNSASAAVLKAIAGPKAPPLWKAPPLGERQLAEAMMTTTGAPGRLYFNVHGTDQEAVWVGEHEGSYPPVLRPGLIRVSPSAIAVSEACYGASLFEGEEAISSSFLLRGAGAFVGSTIIAWGPPHAPPALADLIVVGFYEGLDRGLSAGQALLYAKQRILASTRDEDEPLSPQVHNTLLSFVLYGSPDARVAGVRATSLPPLPKRARPAKARTSGASSAKASGRSGRSGSSGAGGSTLGSIRERLGGRTSSTVGAVRGRLEDGMDSRDWRELSRGRVAFADLTREFARGAELQQRLEALLGGTPASVDVLRYGRGTQQRASVLATEVTPWGKRHVGCVTREDGTVVGEFVSK